MPVAFQATLDQYGLTEQDWLLMYEHQGGKCPVCRKDLRREMGGIGKTPAVDHCHRTGLIRGLLCRLPCNYVMGWFKDTATLFRAVADYLDNPPAVAAFKGPRYTAPGRITSKRRKKQMKREMELKAWKLRHPEAAAAL